MTSGKYTFVDLFSGAGGMSFGFKAHDAFTPRFAVDVEVGKPSSGQGSLECNATYKANIGIDVKAADLTTYEPRQLMRDAGLARKELDVLISCAPCTGFSRAVNKNHLEDDPRNHLVERSALFVDALRPAIFVMENARELIHGNFSGHFAALKTSLENMGYAVAGRVYMLSRFGLPQARERSIVVGVRSPLSLRTLDELWSGNAVDAAATTVRRAIAHLPAVKAGAEHPNDAMHTSPSFSDPRTLQRLKAIPRNGGSWADLVGNPRTEDLLVPSMRRSAERGDFGSHPDVYGRLWWDRPCVTIKRECSHVGNGRYSHPEQDRMCTVRELALINGFPAGYEFLGSLSNRYRHIGDAVPPLISHQLAHLAYWMLAERRPKLADIVLDGTSLRATDIARVDQRWRGGD